VKKSGSFNQKRQKVSFFKFFLWILLPMFGIMASHSGSAAEAMYAAKGRRDPFVPLVGAAGTKTTAAKGIEAVETAEELTVEGVLMDADPNKTVVIVNGEVLKLGEGAGNVKVLKIDAKGALFSINGMEAYKQLYQEDQKGNG
jgi:hypothetical protein